MWIDRKRFLLHSLQSLQNIAIFITVIGLLATILFQVSLSFSKYVEIRKENLNSSSSVESQKKTEKVKVLSVLRNPELYKIALLYTFSRLFLVICIIYIPVWLNEFMKAKPDQNIENIALIPLIFFVASFVAAFLLKCINQNISHKVRTGDLKDYLIHSHSWQSTSQIIYCAGSLISISGCVWITFSDALQVNELFGIAALFGTGSSITQISSLCITADLIGDKSERSGLIYSIITVCDKLFSGIIIFVIEALWADICWLYI